MGHRPRVQDDSEIHTGFLNQIFKYVYAIRRVGKRLKAWHRPTYYVIKWLLDRS